MKIRMTKTTPGSVDGCRVQHFEAEQEYDLSATPGAVELAQAFVGAGFAEEVGAAKARAPVAPSEGADEPVGPGPEAGEPAAAAKPGRKPKAQ